MPKEYIPPITEKITTRGCKFTVFLINLGLRAESITFMMIAEYAISPIPKNISIVLAVFKPLLIINKPTGPQTKPEPTGIIDSKNIISHRNKGASTPRIIIGIITAVDCTNATAKLPFITPFVVALNFLTSKKSSLSSRGENLDITFSKFSYFGNIKISEIIIKKRLNRTPTNWFRKENKKFPRFLPISVIVSDKFSKFRSIGLIMVSPIPMLEKIWFRLFINSLLRYLIEFSINLIKL